MWDLFGAALAAKHDFFIEVLLRRQKVMLTFAVSYFFFVGLYCCIFRLTAFLVQLFSD